MLILYAKKMTQYGASFRTSVVAGSIFADEAQGDVLLYPKSVSQRILIGSSNAKAALLTVDSNQATINGPMNSALVNTNTVSATGLFLTVGLTLDSNSSPAPLVGVLAGGKVMDVTLVNSIDNETVFASDVYVNGTLYASNIAGGGGGGGGGSFSSNDLTLVGTTTLLGPIDVSGIAVFSDVMSITNDSNNVIGLNVSGDIVATGDVRSVSDARSKTALQPIEEALDKVMELTGYTFKYANDASERRRVGLIAQDVQAVVPEAVTIDGDGTLSVSYGNLMGLIVNALKELKAVVDTK